MLRASGGILRRRLLAFGCALACAAVLGAASTALSQQPTPTPDEVRQRMRAMGLSDAQARARMREAGYDPALFDRFMETGEFPDSLSDDENVRRALSALGMDTVFVEGLTPPDSLLPDSLRADSLVADSLARDTMPELEEERPEELPLFGADVFRRPTSQFLPMMHGPVPSNYRLGPGDVLVLVVTGAVELTHTLEVTRSGFVLIPQVGQIYVNNLTLAQLRETLYDRLGEAYSGIRRGPEATTRFEVTLANLRAHQIFVIGEVRQPGAYQLSSVATVLNALYTAGGPTDRGNFRRIQVRRGDEVVATFDLYDYLLRGETGSDIVLAQGDVVFVPVHGTRARVEGAVVRPAIYELVPGETLADLIDAAGGLDADAATLRVSISRIVPPGERRPGEPSRTVFDVRPPAAPETPDTAAVAIRAGDVVTVFEVPEARRSTITLQGHVYHPGTYGWRPGMRLNELLDLGGGVRPAVYEGAVHIERLNSADSTRSLVKVDLRNGRTDSSAENPVLQEYDVVTVYGREQFRTDRTVSISGMVNEPGSYAYRSEMTLHDLVMMAQGLRDGAALDTAEVARLPADRSGGRLATRLRVPLDSSFLLEPETSTYPFLPGRGTAARDAPPVELRPFDHVTVFRQPDFQYHRRVTITGEVAHPGTYALEHADERMSDLVERAGGLLRTAYAEGAAFTRPLDEMGRVNIELVELLDDPGGNEDVILQPGDSLHVPEYNPVVRVTGAVNAPASVLYREGAGIDYYVANAGGYRSNADEGRVSVRYANGSAEVRERTLLLFRSSPTPGPGSVISVPERPDDEGLDVNRLLADLAQIAAALTTIIVVLDRAQE